MTSISNSMSIEGAKGAVPGACAITMGDSGLPVRHPAIAYTDVDVMVS
jgi:hypothetical protein